MLRTITWLLVVHLTVVLQLISYVNRSSTTCSRGDVDACLEYL